MSHSNIVQMQFARCGPARQTISGTVPQTITGLSIDFTPRFADSLILLEAIYTNTFTYVNTHGFYQNGSPIASTSGFSNNSSPNQQQTIYFNSTRTDRIYPVHIIDSTSAGSTTQRTYDVRCLSRWSGTSYTSYVNNRNSNDMASFGHFTVTEIYNGV